MSKRIIVLLLVLFCYLLPGFAAEYPKLNITGYYPLLYNQINFYKVNNGLELNKSTPYIIPGFGTKTKKKIDLENLKVIISTNVEGVAVYPDVVLTFDKYISNLKLAIYHKALISDVLTIEQQATAQTGGLIKDITIDLPNIAIPKTLKRILGNKAGRLNLDGTQRITFSGTSTKRKIIPIYETNRGAQFDLKMQQDTNLRLSGTIGEKIAVNLKYNSNMDETLFDPNNINIKYTGDEDEVVQSIEAGNISLALSGSRYISYSTSSQGLFGIISKLKVGALDVTMIASKEEGQKNSRSYIGQSQADSTIIFSKNFANRTFYYLVNPYELFELETDSISVPKGWVNNAIKTTSTGDWIIRSASLLPKDGSVKVFLDDGDATNDIAAIPGDSVFTSQEASYVPYYDELIEGTDFVTNYDLGTIEIFRVVDRRYTVAVQYVRKDNTPVPLNSNVLDGVLHAKVIRTSNQEYNPTNPYNTWDYQMRNVYSMGISNIKKDGFKLEVYTEDSARRREYNLPTEFQLGGITTYNDYLNLDSDRNGIVNGDDNTVNLSTGNIIIPLLKPFNELGDSTIYREENEFISYDDFKHFISVQGKIGRDVISLGQTGVLKGSVKVKVDGVTQKENIDYIVDYDMGQITFLSSEGKNPDAKIDIDYEYRSGFAVASKSLAGVRADWNITENSKLGGTVIYRSETVEEKRPKIGNENMQLFLADIDGSTTWKPGFLTRWIDAIPLIKTTAESRVSLSAEIAVTVPNISGDSNHKNEAFIDDMEGILDSYPLGLTFSTWDLGSKPWQTSLPKGRINWYNPESIKMNTVYDEVIGDQENENITVLALKMFPNTLQQPGLSTWSYGGIMKYLGNQLDFSNKKYIELLVKIESQEAQSPNITLHVDLGDINEDFYTEYGEDGALNVLNSEDKNNDGVLDIGEDTGLDGIKDASDGTPLPGADPNDNWKNDKTSNGDYPYINGTEGNTKLDTEDLDNNGVLNQLDRYLSYSVSLSDTYLSANPYVVEKLKTKYVLFRIPLNDNNAYQIINSSTTGVQPTLKKISYARIWAETDVESKIIIASASVVGNKWEDFYIRDMNNNIISNTILNSNNETYISGIADNQKSHYVAPPGSEYKESGDTTLEQALTLNVINLQPGHRAFLRQRLFDYYSLLSYSKLKFWVYPENADSIATIDSLDIIFRMGADSLNYYQVRQPLRIKTYQTEMDKNEWKELVYDLQDFSRLKDSLSVDVEFEYDGKYYLYKGLPTLSNIREFVLGIQKSGTSSSSFSGTTYFDDIRVADPYEDMGWAGRLSLNTVFADFATFDIEYEKKSENFNTNIQRGRTLSSSFSSINSLRMSNKYFLGKFLPASWGLNLPLNLDRNYSLSIPRYRANSDLLRSKITNQTDKDRERTEALSYSASLGISQTTTPKSPILAYTINKMALSGRVSQTINNTATTRDTTFAWQGTYNYNVNLPENLLAVPIFKSYKVKLIPGSYTNNFTINSSQPKSYNWETRDTLISWYPRYQVYAAKGFTTDNGLTWAMTTDFNANFRLMTKRDLMQKNYFQKINIGRETEYSQDIGANYSPNYFPNIFTLTNSIASRYIENQRKYANTVLGPNNYTYLRDGNSTRTIRLNLTLMNSTLFTRLASALKSNSKNKDKVDKNKKDKDTIDKKYEMTEEEIKQIEEKEIKIEQDKLREEDLKELDLKEEEKADIELQQNQDLNDKVADLEILNDNPKPIGSNNYQYKFIDWLSKIKNVAITYQNGFNQMYTSKDKRPDFGFQIGLPNQVSSSFLDSRSIEDTYTLTSGIVFSRRIDSIVNYSYSIAKRYSSASNQVVSITFPDVTVSVTDVENLLGISKYMSNTRLNSGYQYILRQNGDINWSKPKQETRTSAFNPLASITTNISKSIQTTLSYTVSNSDNFTDMVSYEIVRSTKSNGLSANLSYAFKSSTGIELPFTKKKINIRNELTSSVTVSYENNYDTTKGIESTQVDRNTSRISISPSATYQFDQNIKGGMTSGYEVTSDKKRNDGTRIFRLGFWIEVTL